MSLFTTFKGVFGAKNGGDATRAVSNSQRAESSRIPRPTPPTPTPPPLPPVQEVKPPPPIRKEKTYAAEKTLGQGTYGTVKQCTHLPTGKKVAIKIMRKKVLKEKNKERMVQDEMAVLSKIRHENCIQMLDFFETEERYYLVFDLASGGELFERIVQKGSFNEREAAVIVATIVNTVAYLHDHEVVHRDLKPENLLFKTADPNAPLTIIDFGIAKHLDTEDGLMRTVCGSPGYTAPEILLHIPYGKPVDIYAIGVIAYTLLCGYGPYFDAADVPDICSRVIRGDFQFESPYWDPVSPLARDFVLKCMSLNPRHRPTAHQLLRHEWLVKYCPFGFLEYLREVNVESHKKQNRAWVPTRDYLIPIPEKQTATLTRPSLARSMSRDPTARAMSGISRVGTVLRPAATMARTQTNGVPPLQHSASNADTVKASQQDSLRPPSPPATPAPPTPMFPHEGAEDFRYPVNYSEEFRAMSMTRQSIERVGILGVVAEADRMDVPVEEDIVDVPQLSHGSGSRRSAIDKLRTTAKVVGKMQVSYRNSNARLSMLVEEASFHSSATEGTSMAVDDEVTVYGNPAVKTEGDFRMDQWAPTTGYCSESTYGTSASSPVSPISPHAVPYIPSTQGYSWGGAMDTSRFNMSGMLVAIDPNSMAAQAAGPYAGMPQPFLIPAYANPGHVPGSDGGPPSNRLSGYYIIPPPHQFMMAPHPNHLAYSAYSTPVYSLGSMPGHPPQSTSAPPGGPSSSASVPDFRPYAGHQQDKFGNAPGTLTTSPSVPDGNYSGIHRRRGSSANN